MPFRVGHERYSAPRECSETYLDEVPAIRAGRHAPPPGVEMCRIASRIPKLGFICPRCERSCTILHLESWTSPTCRLCTRPKLDYRSRHEAKRGGVFALA